MKKYYAKRILSMILAIVIFMSNLNTDFISFAEETDVTIKTFKVGAVITFDEEDINPNESWTGILRPTVFSQPVVFTAFYTDDNGMTQSVDYVAQDGLASDPFYILIEHDGKGAGQFDVINIPDHILVDEKYYIVDKYEISLDTTSTPYYVSNKFIINREDPDSGKTGFNDAYQTTVNLSIQTQKISIKPDIVGDDSEDIFEYVITYTNNNNVEVEKSEYIPNAYSATESEAAVVNVPVGITYAIVQRTPDGYKFLNKYIVTKEKIEAGGVEENPENPGTATPGDADPENPGIATPGDADPENPGIATPGDADPENPDTPGEEPDDENLPVIMDNYAGGTIVKDENVFVTTENYLQNITYPFYVKWIDNNSPYRPELTKDNFIIKYRLLDPQPDEEGNAPENEWIVVNSDALLNLGMSKLPEFNTERANEGFYAFTGLSSVNANNERVEYLVECNEDNIPDNYTVEEKNNTEFIFREMLEYKVDISWLDSGKHIVPETGLPESRPNDPTELTLNLYRRIEGGKYEAVDLNGQNIYDYIDYLTNANNWSVDVPGLPKYADDNYEYDYVLVQGTISYDDEDKIKIINSAIDEYKTYYTNSTGSYAADNSLAHNNGKITERLSGNVEFQATKIWSDDINEETDGVSSRPKSTVTLWRYSVSNDNDPGIDAVYESGLAARVVYHELIGYVNGEPQYKDHMISYDLSKEDGETIEFNSTTVEGLPDNYTLPAYDEQGRKYVYFVRETVEGNEYATKNTYSVENADGESVTVESKYGVLSGGTINNVRREKVQVEITKSWKCPSDTRLINGTDVIVSIWAPVQNTDTYKEVSVLSSEENKFDELSGADKIAAEKISGFTSTVTTLDTSYYINIYDENGQPFDMGRAIVKEVVVRNGVEYTSNNGKLNFAGSNFVINTELDSVSGGNGQEKTYYYVVENAITGTLSYSITKKWHDTIIKNSEEVAKMENVKGIRFRLQRRSNKYGSSFKDVTYQDVYGEDAVGDWILYKSSGNSWYSYFDNLPKYDSEGYLYYYVMNEAAVVMNDGSEKELKDLGWDVTYDRSILIGFNGSTTGYENIATNYISTNVPYISASKTWNDDGDSAGRLPVTVRVYEKSMLKEALDNYLKPDDFNDEEYISLGNLDIPYADYVLNVKNNWAVSMSINSVLKKIYPEMSSSMTDAEFQEFASEYSAGDFVILEYLVGSPDSTDEKGNATGDGAVPAEYIYRELYNATNIYTVTSGEKQLKSTDYMVHGKVHNATRQYRVIAKRTNPNTGSEIQNERDGQVKIEFNKKWNDESNYHNTRPDSVTFELYRNGRRCLNLASQVQVNDLIIKTENCTIDLATGTITLYADDDSVDNNPDVWTGAVIDLPLFHNGVVSNFTVKEKDTVIQSNEETAEYRLTKDELSVEDNDETGMPDSIVMNYSYTNSILGKVSHSTYKFWMDEATGGEERPDLYYNLYRYLDKDAREYPTTAVEKLPSYKMVTDYKDQQWISGVNKPYDWKITIDELPEYDENGNKYVYLFKEQMNNDGINVFGKYVTEVKPYTDPEDGVTSEAYYNIISASVTIKGDKSWTGLSGYKLASDDLPVPTIELYRSKVSLDTLGVSLQNIEDEELQKLIDNGTITLVSETVLSSNKYKFSLPDVSLMSDDEIAEAVEDGFVVFNINTNKYELPKYDKDGSLFVYTVREAFKDNGNITDQLYTKKTVSDSLSNEFRTDINRRKINVTKTWDRKDLSTKEDKYPSVTYYLYRYELEKGIDTASLIDTAKISSDKFAASKDGTYVHTFDDLLIYSPAGKQYGYYVTEKPIKGYVTYYFDENSESISEIESKDINGNSKADVTSLPTNRFIAGAENVSNIGTLNSYSDPGKISITGKKYWNDYNNSEFVYGKRPDSIKVVLQRSTENETGELNRVEYVDVDLKVENEKNDSLDYPYIVWKTEVEGSPNYWEYNIYNIEQYAANGMHYIYRVEEKPVFGYKKNSQYVSKVATDVEVSMSTIINNFEGSYYVRKNWMDGNNKYNLRPSTVTIALQRSKDGTNWENIQWDSRLGTLNETTKKWTGLPTAAKGIIVDSEGNEVLTDIVSVALSNDNLMKNTKGNSWEYTFNNIPEYYKIPEEGENPEDFRWHYRCVEVKIGAAEVFKNPKDALASDIKSKSEQTGAYNWSYPTLDDSKTVVQNMLKSTSLYVEKEWFNDTVDGVEDYYGTRPDSLKFVLEMRGVIPDVENGTAPAPTPSNPDDENGNNENTSENGEEELPEEGDGKLTDWHPLYLADGSVFEFELTKRDGWTALLEDLPVAVVGENGKTYYALYYRAKEVHTGVTTEIPAGTTDQPVGALNYKDITGYPYEDSDSSEDNGNHYYDKEDSRNESIIKNELVLADPSTITVTKTWRREPGEEQTAWFELVYKRTSDTEWNCYGTFDKSESEESRIHNSSKGCKVHKLTSTDAGSVSWTWDKLPKYDREGYELEYDVIEYYIDGYSTDINPTWKNVDGHDRLEEIEFTNIELQDYTVEKNWINTSYSQKTEEGYKATFELQQKIGTDGEWTKVKDIVEADDDSATKYFTEQFILNNTTETHEASATETLATNDVNGKVSFTWKSLPKYTVDGQTITYRVVETYINDIAVDGNTNDSYIVTYQYDNTEDTKLPVFSGEKTSITNRMVYGFVNLSKSAAYLNPAVNPDGSKKLEGVEFDIYAGTGESKVLYVSGVTTDANGNLICNSDGTYGSAEDAKYLISGTYTLVETKTHDDFSLWKDGVVFTVGTKMGTVDTGEHGTAWISTTVVNNTETSAETGEETSSSSIEFNVTYKHSYLLTEHYVGDSCRPEGNIPEGSSDDETDTPVIPNPPAYNLESRGVIQFTKTNNDEPIEVHDSAQGESKVYFGVYTDVYCTEQVAGMMADSTGSNMVLTTIGPDTITDNTAAFTSVTKGDTGIPYLRVDSKNGISLLSGTYYIREIVAPAGYKVDTVVRKAVIPHIPYSFINLDLTPTYSNNLAEIMLVSETSGDTDYNWNNKENTVTIYKRDQFGRKVTLKNNGYLLLTVAGDNKFLTGENTIRLYQNADKPAAKKDGQEFADDSVPDITYNATTECWTITGLFDINKTYTLSEPEASVPDNNIKAEDIVFIMNKDGSVTASSGSIVKIEEEDPLSVVGDDEENYYKSDSENNIFVMRDVSRYRQDVVLEKFDAETDSPIENISFELYRYDSFDADGNPVGEVSVLNSGFYLTTDSNGKIELYELPDGYINNITKCELRYGLDVGKYYFKEVERGASDQYRIADNIYFEISPSSDSDDSEGQEPSAQWLSDDDTAPEDAPKSEKYADLVFTKVVIDEGTPDKIILVEQKLNSDGTLSNVGIARNIPVVNVPKTLELTKVNGSDVTELLSDSVFTLEYVSVNDKPDNAGYHIQTTYYCKTYEGILYLTNASGKFIDEEGNVIADITLESDKLVKPDISKKGDYTLTETKATDHYMTRTGSGNTTPVTMATFKVDTDNKIKNVVLYDGKGELITSEIRSDENSEHISLDLTVKNEKTIVYVGKYNDIESNSKTSDQTSLNGEALVGATLEIYEGTDVTDSSKKVDEWTTTIVNNSIIHQIPLGTLKENTIYTLHEKEAPVGYLEAENIYFMINGTVNKGSGESLEVISQLYVWTDTTIPTSTELTTGTKWSKLRNIKDLTLTMVDEVIIAPVDMQKVVGNNPYNKLTGAEFEVVSLDTDSDGHEVILGTAITDSNGYLVWKEITDEGYDSGLIYNSSQKRVSESDSSTVIGKSIILMQNNNGYKFTEIYAPDNAFNKEESFVIKISDDNYIAYRDGEYKTNVYADIKAANAATVENGTPAENVNTVTNLIARDSNYTADDLVNPQFEATFELYKYDAENPEITANRSSQYSVIGLEGVEFTLTKIKNANGTAVSKEMGVYTTGENGLLSIPITEKGTYNLVETKALIGYKLNSKIMNFTIINSDYKKTLTYTDDETVENSTICIVDNEGNRVHQIDAETSLPVLDEGGNEIDVPTYDLPNYRKHGSIELTKQDGNSSVKLNGVKYVLTRLDPDTLEPVTANPLVDKWLWLNTSSYEVVTGKSYDMLASATASNEIVINDIGTPKPGVLARPGVLEIKDLQWGTYKLVEILEQDGYILDQKELVFTIGAADAENANADPAIIKKVTDTGKEFVSNTKNQLTVKKTDLSGENKLDGAEFKLYPVTEQTTGDETSEIMSDTEASFYTTLQTTQVNATVITAGETTIYGLTKGTYVLRETLAPEGYELCKDIIFTMDDKGVITNVVTCSVDTDNVITRDTVSTEIEKVVEFASTGTGIDIKNNFIVKDTPIEVSLSKKLLNDVTLDKAGRTEAKYQITGIFANGTQSETRTFTGNSITDDLKAILVGGRDYILTETFAPYGYEVPKTSAKLHVNEDGTITVNKVNVADPAVDFLTSSESSLGVADLVFTDKPIEINLSKVNENNDPIDQDELTYAEFSITGKFVSADGNSYAADTITGLTTKDFTEKLSKRLIANEIYEIEETYAPNGYKLTPVFYIQINKFGEIVKRGAASSGTNFKNVSEGENLVVKDEPTVATFIKVDEDGQLAGAEFTLTAVNVPAEFDFATGDIMTLTEELDKAFVNIGATKPDGTKTWTSSKIEWTTEISGNDTVWSYTLTNNLIADVTYKLHEERVFYHEVMSNDIFFHVTRDGKVEIDKNSDIPNNPGLEAAEVGTDNITMTIKNPIIKGSVILEKYWREDDHTDPVFDQTHLLPGAVYTLTMIKNAAGTVLDTPVTVTTDSKTNNGYAYNEDGSNDKFITDDLGKIVITGLPEGTYEFIEVDAPKAYHINNDEDNDKIEFTIIDKNEAHRITANQVDTRINASISLDKISNNSPLGGVVFDVAYSETQNGTYTSIGTMITAETGEKTGNAVFTQGTYSGSDTPEGLRRGFYRLTELSAEGQMLNTTGGTRNTISFEIGNEVNKEYVINSNLSTYLSTQKSYPSDEPLYGVVLSNTGFIELTEQGVVDTPIPTKDVTVIKKWVDDNGMEVTFRPESITVQLCRVYNNGEIEEVVTAPDGTPGKQTLTVSNATADGNNWTYTWNNLPAYVNTVPDADQKSTTYLYTYTVIEYHDSALENPCPSWYTEDSNSDRNVTDVRTTPTYTKVYEAGVEDGNTTSKINNILQGGAESQYLNINKKLGGGSLEDVFYVRVKLTKNGSVVGNNDYGYYLDECSKTTLNAEGNTVSAGTVTPDENGWMSIKGNETISVKIPKGMTYYVEEKTDVDEDYITMPGDNGLVYTPRYDANRTGTIGTTNINTTVRNAVHKSLGLVKTDVGELVGDEVVKNPLEGAHITVKYEPLSGSDYVTAAYTEEFITLSDGKIVDSDGNPINLTYQGTYTVTEVQAADQYITPTDANGTPIAIAVIKIDAEDNMTVESKYEALVHVGNETYDSVAGVNIVNEKTTTQISKTIDYANGEALAGATLQLWQEVKTEGNEPHWEQVLVDSHPVEWTTSTTPHGIDSGILVENTLYKIVEVSNSAPVGYLETEDVYFKIFGTYTDSSGARYSRFVLSDASGNPIDQNKNGTTYGEAGVINGVLTIVDKTIIVPVTLKKVLNGTTKTDLQNVIFEVKDNDSGKIIGTAKTGTDGYLIWNVISADGYDSNLIYKTDKTILKSGSQNDIILKQNNNGYTFTEIEAPIFAYNDGRSFVINPTDQNFKDYLDNDELYLNIRTAASSTMETKATGFNTDESRVINEPYKSTVTLHKYDNDEEAEKAAIADTEFTLYHATVSGDTWTKGNAVTNAYYSGTTAVVTNGKFMTDSDGNLSIEIPEKGYYILEESKPATGYRLTNNPTSFKFQLIDIATEEQRANKLYGYNQSNVQQIDSDGIPNDRIPGQVTLMKKDMVTKEALNGVVFTLTRTDDVSFNSNDYLLHGTMVAEQKIFGSMDVITGKVYTAVKVHDDVLDKDVWSWTITDGTPGEIKVIGLNWGDYKLVEKNELSGYVKDNTEYEFTVEAENLIHEIGSGTPKIVTNTKNEITLHKIGVLDSGEKNLSGAVFEIHEGNTCDEHCSAVEFFSSNSDTLINSETGVSNKVTTVTSGADGTVKVYGLPTDNTDSSAGIKTYHLVETKAPRGYEIAHPVVFTVDRYGNIEVDGDSDTTETEVVMKDEPIEIFIEKIGESESNTLEGAKFTLTDVCTGTCDHKFADGETIKLENLVTDDTGQVMIPVETVIAEHTYKLVETKAPDGYECTSEVTFSVNKNGTVNIENSSGGYTAADSSVKPVKLKDNDTTIVISNELIRLSVLKVDYDDNDIKLEGVKFTLKPADSNSTFINAYVSAHPEEFIDGAITLTTNADGIIDIPEGLVKHDNSYILTETDVGDNLSYRLPKNAADRQITIKVEKNGIATITSGNEMYSVNSSDETEIIVKNQQITLSISKLDMATGKPLAGVTLKLSKQESDSTWTPVSISGVTNTDGEWITTNGTDFAVIFKDNTFIPGIYKLEEIFTPVGYNSIAGDLIFEIDTDGQVLNKSIGNDSVTAMLGKTWNEKNFTITNPASLPNDNNMDVIELKVTNAKYTDLQITKKGSDGKLLKEVKLQIEYLDMDDGPDGTWKFVNLDDSGNAIVSEYKLVEGTAESSVLYTDTQGILTFGNLPDGRYRLKELETAAGYNLLSSTIEIVIDRNSANCNAIYYDSGGNTTKELSMKTGTDILLMTVINQKGQVLPATGTTTPKLPIATLPIVALMEALVLYYYQKSNRRRKRRGDALF